MDSTATVGSIERFLLSRGMARPMSRAEAKSSAASRTSGESSSRLVDRMLGFGMASSRSSNKAESGGSKTKSGERDSPTSRTRGASHMLLDRGDMDPEDLLEHHMNVLIARHTSDRGIEQATGASAGSSKLSKKDKSSAAKSGGGKYCKSSAAVAGSSSSSRSTRPESAKSSSSAKNKLSGKSSGKQAAAATAAAASVGAGTGSASKRASASDRAQSSSAPSDTTAQAGALRSLDSSDSSENAFDAESSKQTVDLSTVDTDTDPECEHMEEEMSDEYTMDGDYHMMDDMDPDEMALEDDELAFEDDDYEMHYSEHLRGRRLDILLGDQVLPSNMNLFQVFTYAVGIFQCTVRCIL